jgi:predicted phage tail protein
MTNSKYIQGSGGGGCFTGDTPVSIPGGSKPIKEINVGDIVSSFDDKGTIYHAKVLKVHEHENEPVVKYTIWGGKTLDATPNHWVLNQFNAFVGIDTLGTDDCLVDEFGHLRPIIEREAIGNHTVYNLTVEGHHTFIANTIRVHNAGLGPNIAGAGGGRSRKGGGGSPPTITPDNLHSKQFATLLDLISEGEIEGFSSPSKEGRTKGTTAYFNAAKKDIFLDDTPILAATADSTNPQSAEFNHQNVDFDVRFGTSSQTKMSKVSGSSSVFNVGLEVSNGVPLTRQLTNNSDLDAVKVTVTAPLLQEIQDDGDIIGSQLSFNIQIQYNGGGFTTVLSDTIRGRTADAYNREYRIALTGAHPVDVRVTKTSANSTDKISRDLIWQSFSELEDDSSTYPDCAYTRLRLDSEFFSRIPARKFKVRGVKVRIPGAGANSSGTPTVDLQTGRVVYPAGYIFNGVMGAAQWTTCPSLILLDLLTNTRYGLGNHIVDSNLDLFSFVTASKFSNELVDDGFGGQEARFACNINIQTSVEAFDVIRTLSGIMRCMPIWSEGALLLTQDSPKDPSYLFTLANVGQEGFSYTGSSLKTRATVVAVSFFNMETRDLDFEEVEAEAAYKNKYGHHLKRVKALGCTSRGQARRFAKAILFTEQRETEVVNFSASMESGVVVRPGTIISVADPARSGVRRGGRIASATTTQITVDDSDATDLSNENNPKLSVILPNGTVETKNITGISGKVITLASALSQTPNSNSVWLLENDTVSAQSFRVMSVEEFDGINYKITALAYVNEKYAFIEDNQPIPVQQITTLNLLKPPPSGLSANETIVLINNQPVSKLIVRWQPVTGVSNYLVNYRFKDNNIVSVTTSSPDFEIINSQIGAYEVSVRSLNAALEPSATDVSETFTTIGKTAVPTDVSGLTAEPINEKLVRLRWNLATDLDVTHGGRVYVRHSSKVDGSGSFSNATDLIEALAGNTTQAEVPYLEGEYILKFQDDGGRFSAGEASVILDLPDNLDAKLIQTRREDQDVPKFQGTKTNVAFDAITNSLNLTGVGQFDSIADFDAESSLDDVGGISPLGTYEFGGAPGTTTLDLGDVYSLDLKRHFLTEAFYPSDLFDSIPDLDARGDFEGLTATKVNATMQVRVTQDNPNTGSPTYTAFQTFANGTYKGRGFQFKVNLTSDDPAQDIRVFQLGYTASMQRRTEQSAATIASGAGAKAVTFQHAFFTGTSGLGGVNSSLPSVGITAYNMASGDFFEVTNVTGTGFSVHFKNSSNNSVDRNFTYQAVGFGKAS